jgi:hypothetical protein
MKKKFADPGKNVSMTRFHSPTTTNDTFNDLIGRPRRFATRPTVAEPSTKPKATLGNVASAPWVASCFEKDCPHPWLDTDGHRIEAHGGAIVHDRNGKIYWFGESAKLVEPKRGYAYSVGVACYSSTAIGGPWTNEGIVLSQDNIKDKELLKKDRPLIIERPKVLFNAATEKYVMWFHLDAAEMLDESAVTSWHKKKGILYKYWFRRAAVATSSSPTGPFIFIFSLLPDGEKSLDLQLYQENDGDAYLVRSVNNRFVGISRLTGDYLSTTGRVEIMVKPALEAVAIFRNPKDQTLYAIASHLTGWEPNPLVVLRARRKTGKPCGIGCGLGDSLEWDKFGNPTGEYSSFNTQPTFAISLKDHEGNKYIMVMFDNWLRAGPRGLRDAGYIWLPLEFDVGGSSRLQKLLNWTTQSPFGSEEV